MDLQLRCVEERAAPRRRTALKFLILASEQDSQIRKDQRVYR